MEKALRKNYIYYTALIIWAVFSIVVAVYFYSDIQRSVYPLFYKVGNAWNSMQSMYTGECKTFSYWPGFSIILGLLARLPYEAGSSLWTLLNIGSIFCGLYMLGRSVFEGLENSRNKTGLLLLLSLPLILEGIFNQQSNSLVAGVSLIGASLIYREKYFFGSVLLLFSGISKIAPMAFVLLFLVMYPRKLWWRYLLALLLLLIIPFALSGYDYMLAQHSEWIEFLTGEDGERWEYRDFFVLYELVVKGKMSTNFMEDFPTWYRGLQVLAAGVLCAVCMWLRYLKKYGSRSILSIVIMSGSVWWLLFGPSTEIATCVAGVGVAGLGVIISKYSRVGWWLMLPAYICVVLGSSGDYEWNMKQLTDSDWIFGMLPFGGLLMYIWVCCYSGTALGDIFEERNGEE